MQRLIGIVALVGAVVQLRSPEAGDVSETREKQKYADLQKKLDDIKKKDGVEEMKAEVSKDKEEEKKLEAENTKLKQTLEDARGKVHSLTDEKEKLTEEDKASSTKLHDLVDKMQSALAVAKGAEDAASAGPATAVSGTASDKAYLQMDPEPVMDKTLDGGVPEQGFEGEAVEHKNGETQTGDWGKEYGGKKKPVPSSAFGPALCLAVYAFF